VGGGTKWKKAGNGSKPVAQVSPETRVTGIEYSVGLEPGGLFGTEGVNQGYMLQEFLLATGKPPDTGNCERDKLEKMTERKKR